MAPGVDSHAIADARGTYTFALLLPGPDWPSHADMDFPASAQGTGPRSTGPCLPQRSAYRPSPQVLHCVCRIACGSVVDRIVVLWYPSTEVRKGNNLWI
jgi:hypothetical protein